MDRNIKLDSLKGFLIILVILGHIIGEGSSDVFNKYCRMFIYTFHMPLFILLSGYFMKIKDDVNSFWKGLLHIVIPLSIFQVINILIHYLIHGSASKMMLIVPYWTLWYLLSLIFWKIILQFSPKKLLNHPLLYLIMAFGVSIICGLLPYGRILSIQRTLNFFPFFLLGYYIKQYESFLSKYIWKKSFYIGIIGVVIFLILFDLYPEKQNVLLKGADNYELKDIPAKIYMLVCAFVASNSIYNLSKENKILAHIGKNSLFYYLYHGLIIEFILNPIIICFELPQTISFRLLYTMCVICLIFVLSKIKLLNWLINPMAKRIC